MKLDHFRATLAVAAAFVLGACGGSEAPSVESANTSVEEATAKTDAATMAGADEASAAAPDQAQIVPGTGDFRTGDRPGYDRSVMAEDLAQLQADGAVILDVRLAEDFDADPRLIPGALRRDPEDFASWADEIPTDRPVVTYCVKGKWVSQKTAHSLAAAGVDAFNLEGGIVAHDALADAGE
ncbi:MAG: rhodanese-like domain-containing protein [Pseudomonadota bacterium]